MTGKLLRLGAFFAVTAIITIAIAIKIEGVTWNRPGYVVSATFDDVTQLFKGDPVKLAGVTVGRVRSIHLVHGRAVVRFSIENSVRIPVVGSSVAVRWRDLIARRELYVDPGPNAGSTTQYLPTDGRATLRLATSAVDVGAFLNALGPLALGIDPNQVNTIFTAISQAVTGNRGAIDTLIGDLNNVVKVFADRGQVIGKMVGDYQTLTGVLAQRDGQIRTMLDNIGLLSSSFTDNTKLFETLVDNLSSAVPNLDRLLARNEQPLSSILDSAAKVFGAINSRLPQLNQALAGAPAAFKAVYATVARGNYVQFDLTCFQSNPMPCTAFGGYSVP
jgi:phospholipid/cholesterol/gamma-HCH transport system substrate-binding protein